MNQERTKRYTTAHDLAWRASQRRASERRTPSDPRIKHLRQQGYVTLQIARMLGMTPTDVEMREGGQ